MSDVVRAMAVAVAVVLAPLASAAQDSRAALASAAQADTFTPPPPNTPPAMPPSPFTINLADNITRLGLAVDTLLPLHGRLVPAAELYRAIGRTP